MTSKDKSTEASAVELNESELDAVQGGGMNVRPNIGTTVIRTPSQPTSTVNNATGGGGFSPAASPATKIG